MRIVLGITGSVAAYKGAALARTFVREGHEVRAIITAAGQRFVTPLQLQALTGHPVPTDMWEPAGSDAMDHIDLARWGDALVIAPATADILAKLSHGVADDLLSTIALAFTGPVFVAPAMNTRMLQHPATVANLATLTERGLYVIAPDEGDLACREIGPGKLAEPETIARQVFEALAREHDYAGVRVLVTAGPTLEPLDPVRTIGNRSSGRMGFALAAALVERGASVRLVCGPTPLEPPDGPLEVVRVETTAEMAEAVGERFAESDLLIMAAAPADWRPRRVTREKVPRTDGPVNLELEPTEDILARLTPNKGERVVVGFALEGGDRVAAGRRKLERKGLDVIAVNDPSGEGEGPGSATNRLTVLHADGEVDEIGLESKERVAHRLLDVVLRHVRTSR